MFVWKWKSVSITNCWLMLWLICWRCVHRCLCDFVFLDRFCLPFFVNAAKFKGFKCTHALLMCLRGNAPFIYVHPFWPCHLVLAYKTTCKFYVILKFVFCKFIQAHTHTHVLYFLIFIAFISICRGCSLLMDCYLERKLGIF